MKNKEYWERFEKTGSISDYLSYIACTIEDSRRQLVKDDGEGGFSGSRIDYDGTGVISDAHWGL